MKLLRRLLGAIVLLLSALGFACCVAGIIGIWMARQAADQKVQVISVRLDTGLERTSAITRDVEQALAKARAEVAKVREQSADLGGGAEKNRLTSLFLRRLVRQEVGPKISDLGGRLATITDATVVVASLLQSLQEMPLGAGSDLHPEKLETVAAQVSQLSAGLQHLQTAVGEGDTPVTQQEVSTAANEVDGVLEKCQTTLADWQADLDSVQKELAQVKARILYWFLLTAIIVTCVCAWVAVSQLSLFAHAWKWCFGA